MFINELFKELPSENDIISNWDNEAIKVSICCIVFNHGDFLESAIKSFLVQKTNFAFEIVLHDDASTDESQSIISKYSKLYPNIIRPIIQKENIYTKKGKPLGVIFNMARGDYFALCEGDDYWRDSNKLQIQYDFMANNPKVSISYHKSILVKNGTETNELALPVISYKNYNSSELLSGRGAISTQTGMMTNKFKKLPEEYFNVMNEDSFLFVIAGMYGDGFYLDKIKPAAYRLHNGGVWSQRGVIEKKVRTAESYYWIAQYLHRKNYHHFANIFRIKAAKAFLYDSKRDLLGLVRSAFINLFR